jgi:hypothetical protein
VEESEFEGVDQEVCVCQNVHMQWQARREWVEIMCTKKGTVECNQYHRILRELSIFCVVENMSRDISRPLCRVVCQVVFCRVV